MSLPTRERGLKFFYVNGISVFPRSLPTRERGLKLEAAHRYLSERQVAPHAGAWIEIAPNLFY